MPQVTALNFYPIKSCGGIGRRSAEVRARGLDGDRRYMLVDAEGVFLTQRRHPRLALVRIAEDGGGYRVDGPGLEPLHLPREWPEGPTIEVRVWRDRVEATVLPDEIGGWFADVLGFPCRVVYLAEHQHRAVPNDAAAFDDEVGFADAAPLLLTSDASLAELNGRLPAPVTMRRFRPNLVVDGDRPFVEDEWRLLRIGDVELEVAWPSTRCVLTTVDPETGVMDPGGEPLRTLRSFRRGSAGVLFGQNVIPRRLGTIRVGDEVEILETR
jgi:uncharacterized protein YcbX